MKIVAVVPARFGSTRLPGKPLLAATGKPLIQHVVESAELAESLDAVIVATDDERIEAAVAAFGGTAVMTRSNHVSGTDRVAEVVAAIPSAEIIINIQGDEPEINPQSIELLVKLISESDCPMATLATPIRDPEIFLSPACVKVVRSARGTALYFSRSPIPFDRDRSIVPGEPPGLLHLGIYAFRRDFLLAYANLPASRLESLEKLEQLRALEAGAAIAVGVVNHAAPGIDTPEDYRSFVERYRLGAT